MSQKKILTYIGSPILSLVILTATAFAINTISSGYQVPAGATNFKVTSSSGCQAVTNSGSADIFVPTNTANEWATFLANKPSYVSLSSCLSLPSAPVFISQVLAYNNQATLIWSSPSASEGITSYRIYRGTSPNNEAFLTEVGVGTLTPVSTTDAGGILYDGTDIYNWTWNFNNVSYCFQGSKIQSPCPTGSNVTYAPYLFYTDKQVVAGTSYYYKISAVNSVGEGGESSEVNGKTLTIVNNGGTGTSCAAVCGTKSLGCVMFGSDAGGVNRTLTCYPNKGCSPTTAYYYPSYSPSACDYVIKNYVWVNCACQ
jgi:hypothetical protein